MIGKEPTIQAQMWQCLKELKTRNDSLKALELELQDSKDNIELLDIDIEKTTLDMNPKQNMFGIDSPTDEKGLQYLALEKRSNLIKLRKLERQKTSVEENLVQLFDRKKWIEEECHFFIETFKNLEKLEPLKHFDDFECQKQYWSEKLSQKLNLKMLTSNQIDSELIETIVSLPVDMSIKNKTLNTLSIRHANMVKQLKDGLSNIEEKKES